MNCLVCSKEFKLTAVHQKYCSKACNAKAWRLRHPDRFRAAQKRYDEKNPNFKTEYVKKNRKKLTKQKNQRYKNDLTFKLKEVLRTRLAKAVRRNQKSGSAIDNLGCSVEELKLHLQAQFEPWMTWENYGRFDPTRLTWSIDHKIPLDLVNLSDPDQLKKVCNYSNLQPLLCTDNSSKRNKV